MVQFTKYLRVKASIAKKPQNVLQYRGLRYCRPSGSLFKTNTEDHILPNPIVFPTL